MSSLVFAREKSAEEKSKKSQTKENENKFASIGAEPGGRF